MASRGRLTPRFRWRDRVQQAVMSRRIFPYLLLWTTALGLLSGLVVRIIDKKDFPTFGTAVWWAIVTLGTVGYGDVVPHTGWGRVVGSVVIIVGVTFISFLIATVTSYFVAAEEARAAQEARTEPTPEQQEAAAALRRIEQRLAAIEAKLGD
jgi:voltage-gated potassium channel